MSGIHGILAPKIITSGAVTINLDYVEVIKDEYEFINTKKKSRVEGKRTIINRGYHHNFHLRMHLYKHGSNAHDKYFELVGIIGDTVTLYRHRDGNPCKDPDGNNAEYVFIELIPYFITTSDYKDGLILKFKSAEKIGSIGA